MASSAIPLRTPQTCIGLLLIALFWPLNWLLPGFRTAYLFFPLWLGYILTVDGLVLARSGTSMLSRSPKAFAGLFVVSAPGWWLFEVINWRTQNWEYQGRGHFSEIEYFVLATISFSTVMPAVFETAEWIRTCDWVNRFASGPVLKSSRRAHRVFFLTGGGMLALTLIWPRYCYPLVWTSVFMLLEPINATLGRQTFFEDWERGDWRPVVSLAVGALVCGFFWEMWNMFSFPKWEYDTPGVEFLHVFEMPLLGYLGYLPFALELHALRNFLWPGAPRLQL